MRHIDGSGGGGQILRSSLALSMVTGEPFRIDRIRAGRKKPGLMRQHLTCVQAAARVGCARVEGAELGSTSITFRPGGVAPGHHEFAISTAGSAGLVLQTVLPSLLTADVSSSLVLVGGTHNAWAPPFDFLARTFLPVVERLGPRCTAMLERYGFFPRGGGRFTVAIEPRERLAPLTLLDRGEVRAVRASVLITGIPTHVAEREAHTLGETLGLARAAIDIPSIPDREGPGNAVLVDVETDALTAVFSAFGRRGVRAETVATDVAEQARAYLAADAPVGPYLADQLLLPLAVGAGGVFRTTAPVDDHTITNAALLRDWLGVAIDVEPESGTAVRVTVEGANCAIR